jgi:ACS family tartrate transporter-like MFS transporter
MQLPVAMINSIGNLGGFAGPYVIGLIKDKTGNLHWGLAFVGISMLVSAMLLMLLPKKCRVRTG